MRCSRNRRPGNFYGNLADEELGRTVAIAAQAPAATAEESSVARPRQPGHPRAWPSSATTCGPRRCGNGTGRCAAWTTASCSPPLTLAKRNQIWDRAINTADRTKNEHDYSLRYLAPYGETVRPAAQNQSADDAWVVA